LLLIPALAGAAVTLAIGHHLWPRFFFFAFGFGALVVIRGVMEIAAWIAKLLRLSPPRPRQLGILGSAVLILVSAASMSLAYGPKQDYQAALEYLDQERMPGDQVVTTSIAALPLNELYARNLAVVSSAGELDEFRSANGSIWLVYTFPEVLASVHPDLMQAVQRDFSLQASFPGTVRSGTIYLMKSN
jgi:hypothetical protein